MVRLAPGEFAWKNQRNRAGSAECAKRVYYGVR
jgi:hypothetical protein